MLKNSILVLISLVLLSMFVSANTPYNREIYVEPTTVYTNDTMIGYCSFYDTDTTDISLFTQWTINGGLVQETEPELLPLEVQMLGPVQQTATIGRWLYATIYNTTTNKNYLQVFGTYYSDIYEIDLPFSGYEYILFDGDIYDTTPVTNPPTNDFGLVLGDGVIGNLDLYMAFCTDLYTCPVFEPIVSGIEEVFDISYFNETAYILYETTGGLTNVAICDNTGTCTTHMISGGITDGSLEFSNHNNQVVIITSNYTTSYFYLCDENATNCVSSVFEPYQTTKLHLITFGNYNRFSFVSDVEGGKIMQYIIDTDTFSIIGDIYRNYGYELFDYEYGGNQYQAYLLNADGDFYTASVPGYQTTPSFVYQSGGVPIGTDIEQLHGGWFDTTSSTIPEFILINNDSYSSEDIYATITQDTLQSFVLEEPISEADEILFECKATDGTDTSPWASSSTITVSSGYINFPVLLVNTTSVFGQESVNITFEVESLFNISTLTLIHTFNGIEESINIPMIGNVYSGSYVLITNTPYNPVWKLEAIDIYGTTIYSELQNITHLFPYEEGSIKFLQLTFDGLDMRDGCNNNISFYGSETTPFSICVNNGTEITSCRTYDEADILDGDILLSDGFVYSRFNTYTPVLSWNGIVYEDGANIGKHDIGQLGLLSACSGLVENSNMFYLDEGCGGTLFTGLSGVNCEGRYRTTVENYVSSACDTDKIYSFFYPYTTSCQSYQIADFGYSYCNDGIIEENLCSYASPDSISLDPLIVAGIIDYNVPTTNKIYSNIDYLLIDGNSIVTPTIENFSINSTLYYSETVNINADIIIGNTRAINIEITIGGDWGETIINSSVLENETVYHFDYDFTMTEYSDIINITFDITNFYDKTNITTFNIPTANIYDIYDGDIVSVWYNLNSLNMTDGCNDEITLSPTEAYPLEICVNDGNTDYACNIITDYNINGNDVISSGLFVWNSSKDYRFKINWNRISYLSGENIGKNDNGGLGKYGTECPDYPFISQSPVLSNIFYTNSGIHALLMSIEPPVSGSNVVCDGDPKYFGIKNSELSKEEFQTVLFGIGCRVTEENYAIVGGDTDFTSNINFLSADYLLGGTTTYCFSQIVTTSGVTTCFDGGQCETGLCDFAGNNTIYTDYFTMKNGILSTNEKIFSDGIISIEEFIFDKAITPPIINFLSINNSNPIIPDNINISFSVSDDTVVVSVFANGCNLVSDNFISISNQTGVATFTIQTDVDCQLNVTVTDNVGTESIINYNIVLEKTNPEPIVRISNKPVYDEDMVLEILYFDTLDNEYNSWTGNETLWYKNDIYQPGLDDLISVDSSLIQQGENWTVSARTVDTYTESEWINDSVLVGTPTINSYGVIDDTIALGSIIDFRINAYGDYVASSCKLTLEQDNSSYNIFTTNIDDNILSVDFDGYAGIGTLTWNEIECIDDYNNIVEKTTYLTVEIIPIEEDDEVITPTTSGGGESASVFPLFSVAEENDARLSVKDEVMDLPIFIGMLVVLLILGIITIENLLARKNEK